MKRSTLDLLCCTNCGHTECSALASAESESLDDATLVCSNCGARWIVDKGLVHCAAKGEIRSAYPEMESQARVVARFYDRLIDDFAAILETSQEALRAEYMDRIETRNGAAILDVGAGTGAELDYLVAQANGEASTWRLFGVDISVEMLRQTQRKLLRRGCQTELFVAFAERLPFRDDAFDAVFHTGSINDFNDQRRAIEEMLRVAKPGARIVIADEWFNEANSQEPMGRKLLETFPTFARRSRLPLDQVPEQAADVRCDTIWKGYGYCIQFRKQSLPSAHVRR